MRKAPNSSSAFRGRTGRTLTAQPPSPPDIHHERIPSGALQRVSIPTPDRRTTMNRLTLTPTVALALALAAMSVPASAASYIPLGPKTYTPQPDIVTPQAPTVTPQAPTVTKSGGGFTSSSSEPHIGNPNPSGSGWYNAK